MKSTRLHAADPQREVATPAVATAPALPAGMSAPALPAGTSLPAGASARQPQDRGDLPFLVRRDGTWLYRGTPIERKAMVCLFSGVLRREADGQYWLQTPAERGRIQVEDTPWVAVELDWCGSGKSQRLTFRTNIDQVVTAGAAFPIRVSHDILTCEPTPYVRVRAANPAEDGRPEGLAIEARICRAVYYELVALAVTEKVRGVPKLGVWSEGVFFPMGIAAE